MSQNNFMNKKFHNLKTVKEIVDVATTENIDVLLADFKLFLELQIKTRSFDFSTIDGMEDFSFDQLKMGESFSWCDDGVVGVSSVRISVDFQEPLN